MSSFSIIFAKKIAIMKEKQGERVVEEVEKAQIYALEEFPL